MPFSYKSGEEIKQGDRVLLHGEPGEIEMVADPVSDPDHWAGKEMGAGIMVVEPKVFGRLFISEPEGYDDLIFVSRQKDAVGQHR